ncbi:MAG: hypothetical protein QGI83_17390 [Candidatus Latescibacteria bacterium]|nr:hypothetical protein [Candidatus Latescibacterota bacterium]
MLNDDSIYISDFRPATDAVPGARTIPSRIDGRDGHTLHMDDGADGICNVPSPVEGWHDVYIGFPAASSIQVRLSGEPTFRWLESSVRWGGSPDDGEEAYWRLADLTAAGFELRPQLLSRRHDRRDSRVAYLRLVPVSDAEARKRQQGLSDRPTRTAGAVIDGHEMLGAYGPQSPDEVRDLIEPFVDSDFRRIHFGCTTTTMRLNFLSKVGYHMGQDQPLDRLHSDGNRRCALALQAAEREGYDPVDILIAHCEDIELELWADFRIQQDYPYDYAGGFGYDFNSPFTDAHQDWRHVDRNGEVCSHLFSHFHPGWEQYKLDLLAELAEKGPAGIHLNLMCEMNAIWDFAPQAVIRFRDEHGFDPTSDPEPPEEWYQFRCDHLTEFMRRLRSQTDRIGRRLGRPIPIAVQVSGDWNILKHGKLVKAVSQNFLAGFDIGRWAREGLVDVVSPSFRRTYKPMFLEHLLDELGDARGRVMLVPSLGQHDNAVFPRGYEWSLYFTDEGAGATDLVPFGELDAWRVLREAHDLYRQGADAVDVWEMGNAPVRLARWNVLKHVGDRDMLASEFGERIGGLMGRPEGQVKMELDNSGS